MIERIFCLLYEMSHGTVISSRVEERGGLVRIFGGSSDFLCMLGWSNETNFFLITIINVLLELSGA